MRRVMKEPIQGGLEEAWLERYVDGKSLNSMSGLLFGRFGNAAGENDNLRAINQRLCHSPPIRDLIAQTIHQPEEARES